MKYTTTLIAAIGALALGLFTTSAQAGPGPHQTFAPVKSAQEAEALKPGTMIAVTCPSCGAVTTMKVDKAKTHMHSMMCGACKHTFEVLSVGGGKASITQLVCKDPTTGKKMPLHMCAEMH